MGMSGDHFSNRRVLSEINVTPLVDVMLVLLVIFMVTAPLIQQGIDVDLPETKATSLKLKEKPFIIYIKKNRKVFFGKSTRPIPLNRIQAKLSIIMDQRKDKNVYIKADKKVEYGFVAQTMAAIQASGNYGIGLVTLPTIK